MDMADLPEDKRKIEKLYEKYNALMFAVSYKILSKKEDMEDAVFHAWERIIKNIDKIGDIDCKETKSFIVIITERISIDHYRKIMKRTELLVDNYEESPYIFTKEKGFEEYETLEWLRSIPKRYSETLILYYVNGLSIKEISQFLGIKEDSVASRLSRGRKYLEEKGDVR
jgi:RNA polymerase sigma-70 factor (ECF subfamily)